MLTQKVGVVGPCAAGKSTLVQMLKAQGVNARHIAQEHSYVPDMWQRISQPAVLIYLDASYAVTLQRRKLNWNENEYEEQNRRLTHARQHADIVIQTDELTPEQVYEMIMEFLANKLVLGQSIT